MSEHHHGHQHETDNYQMEPGVWATGRNAIFFVALLSIVASIAAYVLDPARFFQSYLVAFSYTSAIGIAAFFFVMVQYLSGSAWSVTTRRIMENIMVTLPVGFILFLPVFVGVKSLYPWTDPGVVQASEALRAKSSYLSENFFLLRTAIYFGVWSLWIFNIYRLSTKQDEHRSKQQMNAISAWSAPGLFFAVVVGSMASFDWLMSLQPAWYSTIFGLYYLADGALAFMSVVTLVALGFRKAGILKNSITNEHYHDLGKWLFALTAFYTYIAFSQYLLIWYANLPEETIFYRNRMEGGWFYLSLALPIVRFFLPFFTLLCRGAKRKLTLIGVVAVWSLIVVYVDFYWVVMPNFYPHGIQISWVDFAALGTTVGVCGVVFWTRFKKNKMVPVGDLRLNQSLHFENV